MNISHQELKRLKNTQSEWVPYITTPQKFVTPDRNVTLFLPPDTYSWEGLTSEGNADIWYFTTDLKRVPRPYIIRNVSVQTWYMSPYFQEVIFEECVVKRIVISNDCQITWRSSTGIPCPPIAFISEKKFSGWMVLCVFLTAILVIWGCFVSLGELPSP